MSRLVTRLRWGGGSGGMTGWHWHLWYIDKANPRPLLTSIASGHGTIGGSTLVDQHRTWISHQQRSARKRHFRIEGIIRRILSLRHRYLLAQALGSALLRSCFQCLKCTNPMDSVGSGVFTYSLDYVRCLLDNLPVQSHRKSMDANRAWVLY